MFAVGRYDPRTEDAAAAAAAAKRTKQAKKKRKKTRSTEPPTSTPTDVVVEQTHTLRKVGKGELATTNRKERNGNCSDSSSMPYSSGDSDSSSMPYSSDDDGGSDDDDANTSNGKSKKKEKSSLRVIAPEQMFPAAGVKRRRTGMTDEGLDDFDVEDRQAVGSKTDEGAVNLTDQQRLHNAEISTALQLSRLPIRDAAKVWNLPSFLVSNLERDGYENFFPIQSLVIPDVIASERHSQIRVRDICVSAPTGSGKTLAFVLPVLNALSNITVRRLRALAVLPSRDLATQVFKVFKRYSEGSQLQVGLAIGQTDFEAEQKALILGCTDTKAHASAVGNDGDFAVLRHAFNPTNPKFAVEAIARSPGYFLEQQRQGLDNGISSTLSTPMGGRSAVDVLVATPGRLIDHLDKTPGFTLQHLRFLVIDEADRLLNQSYQGWIQRVTTAATVSNTIRRQRNHPNEAIFNNSAPLPIDPITWRKSMTNDRSTSIAASVSRPVPLRKMLFSATLTRDPQKLASLGLVNPKHFDAHHLNVKGAMVAKEDGDAGLDLPLHVSTQRYSVPPSLSEHKLVCTAEQKPLVLLALLLQHLSETEQNDDGLGNMVVVFTSSLDSTHRLARLLQLLWSAAGYGLTTAIAEFSSALSQKQRSKLMRRCADTASPPGGGDKKHSVTRANQNRVSVIICSDGMSRGMDLPNVGAVINYDVPRYAKTYVHRCGRTARAGKKGRAISVLKGGQVGEFVKMRKLIDNPSRVEEMKLKKELVGSAIEVYPACMKSLRGVIDAEESGDLEAAAPLADEWVPQAKSTGPTGSNSAAFSSGSSDISSEEDDESKCEGE